MMKLLYLANIRLPTEKAHGLQIMQMCEAFAQSGASVTLAVARRDNSPEMAQMADPWAYYGVAHTFDIRRLPCIDLFRLGRHTERFAFLLQSVTYTMVMALWVAFRRAEGGQLYYSRDPLTLLVLSLFKPRKTLCYEAHQLAQSRFAEFIQNACVRRAGLVVAVTGRLAQDLAARARPNQMIVAHDGFQQSRFAKAATMSSVEARRQLGLPPDAFIVGYVGRLHTMNMSKGIDKLIEAIATMPGCAISLCLVGGPPESAEALRAQWLMLGLPPDRFILAGQIPPNAVPVYLAAFDVAVNVSPDLDFFKYHSSPLKLFEYMACGKAIISSDHPAVAEVLHDGENGLLVPFGETRALAQALARLHDDPFLRQRLGSAALQGSAQYAWDTRARRILREVGEAG